ncbi:hypothetical protein L3X38_016895 [Prunus dulcis]|uniref:Rx N-terminal domain-containing protein n=1 Tax=Prunus dulcis TaxID=3755 RepID=A0AAD4W7T8_PRUDU|nr:hypothetical protein L3X38_016895 [Prunus dulcis]
MLEDAERRQVNEVFVRNWLHDLKEASFDLEDVLDERDTAILKIKIQKLEFGVSEKVRFCRFNSFLCFSRVGQRRHIDRRMKDVRERLSVIAFEREEYFMSLAMRSFFQDFEKDYAGNIIRCKMHDLVHDFAQFLMKDECFIMEVDGVTEKTRPLIEKVRLATFVLAFGAPFPVSTWEGKSERNFFVLGSTNTTINPGILLHLSGLRTLNLSGPFLRIERTSFFFVGQVESAGRECRVYRKR